MSKAGYSSENYKNIHRLIYCNGLWT